ncbi:hypothetical protein SLEP1_g16967 [Rubroshorea leprosula]|uniref:CTLH domain-containing protein n=1 Tax=Rubroshorea leprosula TaxID=152421 RepID=A0AAV5J350_9ROSI|nr:hypothetical protein SLEP1_g16967 [Rubroshorea leprosula]
MKIYFEIRKQKYLEALDRHDRAKAVEILVKDLKVFSTFNEELYKETTQLLTLENFRENEQLSKYGDTKSARSIMLVELKKLIEANPLFRDKLVFPTLKASRLRALINQSLNWQHQLCKNPRPNPDIKTLFTDHTCSPPNGARVPTPVTLPVAAVAKPTTYAPLGAHSRPFPPAAAAAAASANALAGWMINPNPSSSVQSAVIAASSLSVPPNQEKEKHHQRFLLDPCVALLLALELNNNNTSHHPHRNIKKKITDWHYQYQEVEPDRFTADWMAKNSLEIINLCWKSLPRVFWLIILADADSIASLPRRRHRRGGAQLCGESRGHPTRFDGQLQNRPPIQEQRHRFCRQLSPIHCSLLAAATNSNM